MSHNNIKSIPKPISVIIPCFNGEQYIGQLLDSLHQQRVPAGEIIVIDDGSTDASPEIVNQFNNVKLIRHASNRGLARARNTGWNEASHAIVAYLDVDTTVPSNYIERLSNLYTLYPEAAGIGGQAKEVRYHSLYDRWRALHLQQTFGDEPLYSAPMLWGVCSSYRRDVLQQLHGFRVTFTCNGEDVDLGLRMKNERFTLLYHPSLEVYHHKSDDFESLKKTVYRWVYWGAVAHRKNGHHPLPGLVKVLTLKLWRLVRHPSVDPEINKLTLRLWVVMLRAMLESSSFMLLNPSY